MVAATRAEAARPADAQWSSRLFVLVLSPDASFAVRRFVRLLVPAAGLPSTARLAGSRCWAKAGEGNRTLVFSLEGYCSTIELHPRSSSDLSFAFWRVYSLSHLNAILGSGLSIRDAGFQSYLSQLPTCSFPCAGNHNGRCRIRTCEGRAIRFTV